MIAKKAVQINRVECKYFSLNNWLIGNLLLTFSTFAGSFQSPAKPIFFAIKFNRTSAFLGCLDVRKSIDSGNQINKTTKSKPVKKSKFQQRLEEMQRMQQQQQKRGKK